MSPSARVLAAHRHLAAGDEDHATKPNGIGYNRADTYIGHDLSALDTIAGEDLLFAWHLAETYTKQLERSGIILPAYREIADELGIELTEDQYEEKRARLNTERRDRRRADAEAERKTAREKAQKQAKAGRIEIDTKSGCICTTTEYDAAIVAKMRAVQGRRWLGGDVNTFPLAAYEQVRAILPDAEIVGEPPAVTAPAPSANAPSTPPPPPSGYIKAMRGTLHISFGGYFEAKINLLKEAIPYKDREWDGANYEWKVASKHLSTVLELFPELDRDESIAAESARLDAARLAAEQQARAEAEAKRRHTLELRATLGDLATLSLAGRTLYEHQRTGVETMLAWERIILADDMGLGKTTTSLVAALAYQRLHDAHVFVVCPASLRTNWAREAAMVGVKIEVYSWAKLPQAPNAPFIVIGDECFPASTIVETDHGPMPIGSIVNDQLPVRLLSRNPQTGALEYKSIARYVKKVANGSLYNIRHEQGDFTCTGNHRIWIEGKGYVRADEIVYGDQVRVVRSTLSSAGPEDRSSFLRPLVLEYEESIAARIQGAEQRTGQTRPSSHQGLEAAGRIEAHEGEQSHALAGVPDQNGSETQRPNIFGQGRQRQAFQPAIGSNGSYWFANRSSNQDESCSRAVPVAPHALQGGPWASGDTNGNRDRRENAQDEAMEVPRPSQDGNLECSRVVSIEILERGGGRRFVESGGDDPVVYNLEVEGHHNYFANGVLVSNCHYAQNLKAQRTKNFLILSERAMAVFCLTGTPIKNGRPVNLFPLLVATRHELGKNKSKYEKHFCDAHDNGFGWDVTGAAHLDELHEKTKDVILRRLKSKCLDLPKKSRILHPCEISAEASRAYWATLDQLRADYEARLAAGQISDEGEALVILGHLRHASSQAKLETAIEMAEEVLEQGAQVVLFTVYQDTAEQLAAHFRVPVLHGGVPSTGKGDEPSPRQEMVDAFQAGTQRVFVSTIAAGGVGITLTKGTTAILVDRPWTPGDAEQAEDRIYRIGQTEPVTCYWLQAFDIDAKIDAILEAKQERIEMVLAGKRKTLRGVGHIKDVAKDLIEDVFGSKRRRQGEAA